MAESIENPILNSPYEQPDRYYEVGPKGPTGVIRDGRRPSESFIPIAMSKKGRSDIQEEFDFDATGERRERNTLINDLRREVEVWRRGGQYSGVPFRGDQHGWRNAQPPPPPPLPMVSCL